MKYSRIYSTVHPHNLECELSSFITEAPGWAKHVCKHQKGLTGWALVSVVTRVPQLSDRSPPTELSSVVHMVSLRDSSATINQPR